MARINNTEIYPIRTSYAGGLLLGSDGQGRTVNFVASPQTITYVYLDGFEVVADGKTDMENWEDGDRFSGWYNNVYYVGRILDALELTMPDDINDTSKVSLALQNPAI